MEFIKLDEDRYLIKDSNRIVSKKEKNDIENRTFKKTKQIKRTDSKS